MEPMRRRWRLRWERVEPTASYCGSEVAQAGDARAVMVHGLVEVEVGAEAGVDTFSGRWSPT